MSLKSLLVLHESPAILFGQRVYAILVYAIDVASIVVPLDGRVEEGLVPGFLSCDEAHLDRIKGSAADVERLTPFVRWQEQFIEVGD